MDILSGVFMSNFANTVHLSSALVIVALGEKAFSNKYSRWAAVSACRRRSIFILCLLWGVFDLYGIVISTALLIECGYGDFKKVGRLAHLLLISTW